MYQVIIKFPNRKNVQTVSRSTITTAYAVGVACANECGATYKVINPKGKVIKDF
jgi:hypothetical protein